MQSEEYVFIDCVCLQSYKEDCFHVHLKDYGTGEHRLKFKKIEFEKMILDYMKMNKTRLVANDRHIEMNYENEG